MILNTDSGPVPGTLSILRCNFTFAGSSCTPHIFLFSCNSFPFRETFQKCNFKCNFSTILHFPLSVPLFFAIVKIEKFLCMGGQKGALWINETRPSSLKGSTPTASTPFLCRTRMRTTYSKICSVRRTAGNRLQKRIWCP